jgi:hypothetical protein
MKIVYLILAHRYPEQLVRLVQRLQAPDVRFFIHLDKKMEDRMGVTVKHGLKNFDVTYVKRHTCHWAGFGIMKATFQGLKEITESGIEYDYVALMSGQDYPIKSNAYIKRFFEHHKGTSFIEYIPFPKPDWIRQNGGWDRVKYWHFRGKNFNFVFPFHQRYKQTGLLKKLLKLTSWMKLRRSFPEGMHPFGGAQFWALHKSHADLIVNFIANNKSYFNFFRNVYVSDELLFQTIIGNLADTTKIHNDTLHFLEWRRKGAILYTSDFENIRKTDYLYARKFDATVDPNILDLIDQEILSGQSCNEGSAIEDNLSGIRFPTYATIPAISLQSTS